MSRRETDPPAGGSKRGDRPGGAASGTTGPDRGSADAPAGLGTLMSRLSSRRPRRSAGPESVSMAWSTRDELPDEFQRAWIQRLARTTGANFSLRLDHVLWEADRGRHALLVLAEQAGRRGAIVLREGRGEWVSGWPWRWQAALEQPEPGHAPGLSSADAAWLFGFAERHAGGARIRAYLPAEPANSRARYVAGATIFQALQADDAEMLSSMDANKRRLLRRAQAAGYAVREAAGDADWRDFARVQHDAMRLRAPGVPPDFDPDPPPGDGFREWGLPWMWLLLAHREGRIVAGVGDGIAPGGFVDGRAAAAEPESRRSGVMPLLCHHEARWLRDHGHEWLNHGGDTVFKREIAGQLGRRLVVWCWLGGGGAWRLANRMEAWARNARPRVVEIVRSVGVRGALKGRIS